ncbi:DMT family transporter [Neptunomonas phycophila]|uniref:DMT family transporter n=1 Tax=Neptunomonas phycophila TaxID=1572645 RepID=UPI001BE959AB|nr:DMT family transporter [Neptunomonas phycophila]MBT3147056.1 DMT family transporter [Neptunomonas phycophila]
MDNRKALDGQAYGLMTLFCLLLGLQQIALKFVAADISPILQIAIRSGIAAVLVGLVIYYRRIPLVFAHGSWKPGILVGVLFSLEYVFLGEALRYTSAAHAVVFLYTSPIFTVLVLHFMMPSERLAPLQWGGVLLAFIGIVIAFLETDTRLYDDPKAVLWGDFLAILAGASWGLTTIVIRVSSLSRISSMQTLMYQLVIGCLVLSGSAVALDQLYFNPSVAALLSIGFQSIMVSFLALMIWFWLINQYLASRIGVLSFMTPVIGVIMGAWLLGETLTTSFIVGSICVLLGVVLVSAYGMIMSAYDKRKSKLSIQSECLK